MEKELNLLWNWKDQEFKANNLIKIIQIKEIFEKGLNLLWNWKDQWSESLNQKAYSTEPEKKLNEVGINQFIQMDAKYIALFSIFSGFGIHSFVQKNKNVSCGPENGRHQWSKYDHYGYFKCNIAQNFGCMGFYRMNSYGDAKYCQNTGCGIVCCRKCG